MADDLQAIQQGVQPSAARAVRAPAPGRASSPRVLGKSIALPGAVQYQQGGLPWVLLGMAVAFVLVGGVWSIWTFVPRGSGTVADGVPVEALAFLSVQRGSGPLESSLVPAFAGVFGMPEDLLGDNWTDVAYVLLPGGSPAEPVPTLLLRGRDVQPRVESVENVAVKNLPSGAVAIMRAGDAGRLDGLSGSSLGRDRGFRHLLGSLPRASALLYLREGQVPFLLQPFFFIAPAVPDSVLLALNASGGAESVITITGARSARQVEGGREAVPAGNGVVTELLSRVPAGVLTLAARPHLSADIDAWRVTQSGNPALQDFFRAFSQAGTSLDTLRQLLAGPYLGGSLPTSAPGVRDGFMIVPLKEGTTSDAAGNALRPLEDVFRRADVFLTGSKFPDVVFEEASYNGVKIRFVNFGTPDRAFDYATADTLLLVGTSRGSMSLLLDVLGERAGATLASDPIFRSLVPPEDAAAWNYLRVDDEVLKELPQVWQPLFNRFQGVVLVPVGKQALTGAAALKPGIQAPPASP